jgi:hypothetical protein
MQFFKPENYFTVREALIQVGRQDLIGSGGDCLIPAQLPREALKARQQRANEEVRGDPGVTVPTGGKARGYRPQRKTAKRRDRQWQE